MKKQENKKPIYMTWWFWVIIVVIFVFGAVILVMSLPKKQEKEYMSPNELSAKIEKDRQAAIEWQRESTKELAKATKDAVLAYKELYGVYPSKLTDIEGFNDNGTITYSYDGINLPTISYNLDGEIVTETVK